MDPTWVVVATGTAATVAVLVVAARLARWTWRTARKLGHLVDDLAGEPARPGTPARPSLMQRVATVEQRTQELTPNGGTSIKDRISSLDTRLAHLERRLGCPGAPVDGGPR